MRRFRLSTLRVFVWLLFLGLLTAIVLRWISLERWRWNLANVEPVALATPRRSAAPTPTPPPKPPVIGGKLETARLFSGINLRSAVEAPPGRAASEERVDPDSYVLDLKLQVRMPAPNKTIEELASVNPELPRILPGLAAMLGPNSVSPFFAQIYDTKLKGLRANLGRLDQLLSRHNFYDTQTVLQLRDPKTQRKAVLLQSDMDVDSDGSDSDRLPAGSGTSPNFQSSTSYRWDKKSQIPNPYIAGFEAKVKASEAEAALPSTSAERKRELKSAAAQARSEIETLKRFSFLIGTTDPFIVIPGGFTKTDGAKVGDYAVVVYGDAIYPAIVGDVGPPDKAGEASLRIAKEIGANASPTNRTVNDLKATYLIFPGTAETQFGPPDLDKIHDRCEALVNETGGAGVPLHRWENIIPPLPTPTPSPTATPAPSATTTASPSASPSASASGSPGASPTPTFAFPLPSPSATPTATPTPSASAKPSSSPIAQHKRKS
ncbi:MAG: glycoside hydrolase family 75 protein [Chthoniobacterales bacterium]